MLSYAFHFLHSLKGFVKVFQSDIIVSVGSLKINEIKIEKPFH